jgi:MFS family permease
MEPVASVPWWRLLNRYQWSVFILASLGWMFDCLDQQLFTMSRSISMRDLVPEGDLNLQNRYGGYATTCFILGWATGGLIFGVVGDLWGRAKTMALTIFVYAVFTGLSALSRNWVDFSIYRFLTGLGVGGEFAVGVALIAEVMPDGARAQALGSLQALSAFGNITAAILIGFTEQLGGWRNLYYVGAAPAILAAVVIFRLKEPEKWVVARATMKAQSGPRETQLVKLLGHPRWRRHVLVGLGLAVAGVLGLWGVAFWSGELIDSTLPTLPSGTRQALQEIVGAPTPAGQAALIGKLDAGQSRSYLNLYKYTMPAGFKYDPARAKTEPIAEAQKQKMSSLLAKALDPKEEKKLKRTAFILQQVGGFLGILTLSAIANRFGRKPALAVAMIAGYVGATSVFYTFADKSQIIYLWPWLGFCTLMPFGGFAIYFPELFPTSLRSTGVSFCYNVGRYITSAGPIFLPWLAMELHGRFEMTGFRAAALILCSAYFLGLIALIWAPETKGQPLPSEALEPAH